ncbi:MAG: Eco57I restriction-modification methylase domain-containing protein [Prevotella sp.]|nr:Eco57I restriction-modification methylase domain-containing protein [Prevotella sp.]
MNNYNPDVLSCLANLSNDEVFTPPQLANQMLDMLPQELFRSPDTKFLDPCTKSGVFLREIAKRLIDGLADTIPDLQKRIDHIMHHQLYGIAITRLTSLMSRRSLYCSKDASCRYSISLFDNADGNIRFSEIQHSWQNGKCRYCGASQEVYDRGDDLESHAYEFIHTDNPNELYNNMTFDVIIGNPPYQLSDGGGMQTDSSSGSAIPLYHKFIIQAKRLSPRYLTMIIPARWYSGGRGLDDFRDMMLNDARVSFLVDFPDSKECFPGVDIAGGICYFLWNRDYSGQCTTINIDKGKESKLIRRLNEFPVFVRYAISVNIIHKILSKKEICFDKQVYSSKPFGFRSFEEGSNNKFANSVALFGSKGITYVKRSEVNTNSDLIDKWKVVMSKASAEHAGQTDRDGRKRIISRIEVLPPNVICSESYLLIKAFDKEKEAQNLKLYARTNFFRFLLSTILLTQNIAKDKFQFVPLQDFSKPWTDSELYAKYGLTDEEIQFIESMIRPME